MKMLGVTEQINIPSFSFFFFFFWIFDKQHNKMADKDQLSSLLDDALSEYESQQRESSTPLQTPPAAKKSPTPPAPPPPPPPPAHQQLPELSPEEEETVRQSLAAFEEYLNSAAASLEKELGPAVNDEESASKALVELFKPFISKELLHAPLTELRNKYPAWLEKRVAEGGVTQEEKAQREAQYQCICKICEIYEKQQQGSELSGEQLAELVKLIEMMGQPPQDLVQELAISLPMLPGDQASSSSTASAEDTSQQQCPVQ
mgnify:CR=1 FL=1